MNVSDDSIARMRGEVMNMNSEVSTQRLTGTFRRNGKLQACEPCRKSKLRCDHVLPYCGRCAKRKRTDKCVYETSPLPPIQRRQGPNLTPPEPLTPTTSTAAPSLGVVSPKSPISATIPSTTTPGDIGRDYRTTNSPSDDPPVARIRFNPGFLGSTSYSSIFTENLEHLGIPAVPNDVGPASSVISDCLVREGVRVLKVFNSRSLFNRFQDRWYELTTGKCIPESLGRAWSERLWSVYGDILEAGKPEQLHALSQKIWYNTLKPVQFDRSTCLANYIELTSGENLRWPVLGILACIIGTASRTLISSDPIFATPGGIINSKKLAVQMWEAAEDCIACCKELEIIDDLFVFMLCETDCLTGSLRGEASYFSYQRSGELINALIAMGLHGEIKVDKNTPFFMARLRQRALIQAYGSDTSLATFLGRPPRLSYRFCILESPPDLDDSVFLLEGDSWKDSFNELDENGWNTTGRLSRQTWLKALIDISKSREDILEMNLTRLPADELLRKAEKIRQRADEQFAMFPKFIQQEWTNPWYEQHFPGPALRTLFVVCFRLGYLSNDLLLQRILVKRAGADHWTLVQIARGLFKEVLKFVSRADLTRDFQTDLSWILVSHGIRSAAIVSVQLLKQEMLSGSPSDHRLPRSETIQDLSVFASCLGAIDRDDGNYSVCDQGQRVIRRILDKILELPARPPAQARVDQFHQNPVAPVVDTFPGLEDATFDFDASVSLVNDADFVQWLESVDWDKSTSQPPGIEIGSMLPRS